MALSERQRDKRNLDPHKAAVAAMWIWGSEYGAQRGGSMDFWNNLTEGRKRTARELVDRIAKARERSRENNNAERGRNH